MKSNESNRRVTLRDIAELTGYSANTVSRALAGKSDIPKVTADKIKTAAKSLGYLRNAAASSMRTGRSYTYAAVFGDIMNPNFSIMAKQIEELIREDGCSLMVMSSDENAQNELSLLRAAVSSRVDGIFLCPAAGDHESIEFLESCGTPFVLIGRECVKADGELCAPSVTLDDYRVGYLAGKRLTELSRSRPIMLSAGSDISSGKNREDGFAASLREQGVILESFRFLRVGMKSGRCVDMLSNLLEQGIEFDSIFAFSDLLALEAIGALNRLAPELAKDIAIVGCDNIQSYLPLPPRIDSIYAENTTMPSSAYSLLKSGEKRIVRLPVKLITADE